MDTYSIVILGAGSSFLLVRAFLRQRTGAKGGLVTDTLFYIVLPIQQFRRGWVHFKSSNKARQSTVAFGAPRLWLPEPTVAGHLSVAATACTGSVGTACRSIQN